MHFVPNRAVCAGVLARIATMVTLLAAVSVQAAKVVIYNPQPNDIISTTLQPSSYLINGTVEGATGVTINIWKGPNILWAGEALVRDGVFDLDWAVGVSPFFPGTYRIEAVPHTANVTYGTDKQSVEPVALEKAKYPTGQLLVHPTKGTSLYVSGSSPASVPIQLRAVADGGHSKAITKITLSASGSATAPPKDLTTNDAYINDGDYSNDSGLPFTFTLPEGSTDGVTTLTLQLAQGTTLSSLYNRVVIVDTTAPILPAPAITKALRGSYRISGTASDGDAAKAVSGIGSVRVTLRSSHDETLVMFASLAQGATAHERNWTVETPPLVAGDYDLEVVAVDNAGNSAQYKSSAAIKERTGADSIEITKPASNGAKVKTLAVEATITSYYGLASYQFTLNGTKQTAVELSGGPVSYSISTLLGGIEGNNAVRLDGTDLMGRSITAATRSVIVDTVLPVISVTSATSGHTAAKAISATVADASPSSGLKEWTLSVNGNVTTGKTSTITGNLEEGLNTVIISAADNAENKATTTFSVTLLTNTIKPIITAPVAGAFVKPDVKVIGNTNDPNTKRWEVKDGTTGIGSGSGPAVSVEQTLGEGSHSLTLESTNQANTVTKSDPVVFTVDKYPPVISVTSATSGYTANKAINATVTDDRSGLKEWTLSVNGNVTTGKTSPITGNLEEGLNAVVITVTDNADNQATKTYKVTALIDKITPVITSPVGGSYVKGVVQVTGATGDPNTRTWRVTNGSTTIGSGTGSTVSFQWTTPPSVERAYTLTLEATNQADKMVSSDPITVNVDNIAPIPTLHTDPAGTYWFKKGDVVKLSGTVGEANPKSWKLGDGWSVSHGSSESAYANFTAWTSTADLPEGQHFFVLEVTDKAGNTSTSPPAEIRVDRTPPAITIASPNPDSGCGAPGTLGMVVRGKVTIAGTVTDDFPQTWSVTFHGNALNADNEPLWEYTQNWALNGVHDQTSNASSIKITWDTKDLLPFGLPNVKSIAGTLQFDAVDSAGNVSKPKELPIRIVRSDSAVGRPVIDSLLLVNGSSAFIEGSNGEQPGGLGAGALGKPDTVFRTVAGKKLEVDKELQAPRAFTRTGLMFRADPPALACYLNAKYTKIVGGVAGTEVPLGIGELNAANPEPLTLSDEGRFDVAYTATNDSGPTIAHMDVTIDKTGPMVSIQSPIFDRTAGIEKVPPGGVLTIRFRVDNLDGEGPAGTATGSVDKAPLTRIRETTKDQPAQAGVLEAPQIEMIIRDIERSKTVGVAYDLKKAIAQGSLGQVYGSATVTGDKWSGYIVTWNIPIGVAYRLGTYEVQLSGATDIVGNSQYGIDGGTNPKVPVLDPGGVARKRFQVAVR